MVGGRPKKITTIYIIYIAGLELQPISQFPVLTQCTLLLTSAGIYEKSCTLPKLYLDQNSLTDPILLVVQEAEKTTSKPRSFVAS